MASSKERTATVASEVFSNDPEEDTEEEVERRQRIEEAKEKGLTCRTCDQYFDSVEAQQAHFKSDWHLFNLQRKLIDQPSVDEATFTALRDESLQNEEQDEDEDEMENYHQSDSSEDSDEETGATAKNKVGRGPRMRIVTTDKRIISFWRVILPSRDYEDGYSRLTISQEQGSPQLQEVVRGLGNVRSRVWVFLMCSGGYFAGSVFDGNRRVDHKTFRRYTVRRKQGGSQSARDAKGNKPRSAGAYMRRYHEAQLQREIRALLDEWRNHFEASALVFYYLPGGGINRHMFFYEGSPLGTKKGRGRGANPKLRSIPFHIERPSVTAIQKAHEILSTIDIEDESDDSDDDGDTNDESENDVPVTEEEDAGQHSEVETRHRPLADSQEAEPESTEEERRVEAEIIEAVRARDVDRINALFDSIADTDLLVGAGSANDLTPLYVACEMGDTALVELLLDRGQPVNTRIPGYRYWTALHRASADGHVRLVELLLARGADPTMRGVINKTPADLAAGRETRLAFRRFAGEHLEAWDWAEARVVPLTSEAEADARQRELEKKRKRKEALKARKAREREEEEARLREQEERRRAKQQRDRERRRVQKQQKKQQAEAEAEAERQRLAAAQQQQLQEQDDEEAELQRAIQLSLSLAESSSSSSSSSSATASASSSSTSPTAKKPAAKAPAPGGGKANGGGGGGPECDQCHKRMGEKAVPFYRLSYKYCSTKCVQEHRKILGR